MKTTNNNTRSSIVGDSYDIMYIDDLEFQSSGGGDFGWSISDNNPSFGGEERPICDGLATTENGNYRCKYKLINENEEEVMDVKTYSLYNVIVVDEEEAILLDTKVVSFSDEGAKVVAGAYGYVKDLEKATIIVSKIGNVITPVSKREKQL